MDTAIVIPTFGQEDFTVRCFDSIAEHSAGYQLIWADNGSSRESQDIVQPSFEKSESAWMLNLKKNYGFVTATNLGIKKALDNPHVKYIVLQNNDTEVTAGWLHQMRMGLQNYPDVGAVGPVTTYGAKQQAWTHIPELPDILESDTDRRRIYLERFNNVFSETPILTFFCTMFRREVFEKLGLLDEDYGVGLWDDQDLCEKMRNAGMKMSVAMGAYVRHYHRTTFKAVYTINQINQMKKENQGIYARKSKERSAKN